MARLHYTSRRFSLASHMLGPYVEARVRNDRCGSALFLALVLTLSLAGLATSAIFLSGNSALIATSRDREADLKYASEAALAIGKSRLNSDPLAVPDTGYTAILNNQSITGADGQVIPGIGVNMYVGPTSSNTGQFGKFVSVVTQATDTRGGQFVRRLELAQESFAKFAYWSNSETNNGSVIYFGGNDQLWGPVWSNDVIHIYNSGATFHDDVGTAQTISGVSYGTFTKGYSENQRAITLPNNTTLSNLPGYASAGNESFTAPNSGTTQQALMRIEFDAVDLNGDGKINGTDEGFFKVYVASTTAGYGSGWLRADATNIFTNCGASFRFKSTGPYIFVPISVIGANGVGAWFQIAVNLIGLGTFQTLNGLTSTSGIMSTNLTTVESSVMTMPTARCYLGGDPHLAAIERPTSAAYITRIARAITYLTTTTDSVVAVLGGDSTTWTDSSAYGHWLKWPGTVDARVTANRPSDATRLFPIYRGLNSGTKGVIYVNGTTGVSGTLRGRITIYATGNVSILDDLKYATDPSLGLCTDILGVIGGQNIFVADNDLNSPINAGSGYRSFDDSQDLFLQGVLMALNTSFGAENYDLGPTDAIRCDPTLPNARGCLYLTGGLIQNSRGPVGTTAGTGYVKRYSYDQCALYNPPPYFPTTGRYTDNRYYEMDPARFNVSTLYRSLTPGP